MKHKHTLFVILVVYLLMSFFPQIGLMSLLGKKKKGR